MGLNRWQRLWRVELPLALPVILTGIRLSVVIALGTATIGSTVAARTLGEVIIAGLLTNNTAYVLQGGLIVGLLRCLSMMRWPSLNVTLAVAWVGKPRRVEARRSAARAIAPLSKTCITPL